MKETELAKLGRRWLMSRELEVFEEVVVYNGLYRADLVGRGRGLIVVVEAKLAFGLDVIAQGHRWEAEASEAWVLCRRHQRATWELGIRLCTELGIGVLSVTDYQVAALPRVELQAMRRHPKGVEGAWADRLFTEQQTDGLAGTNGGGYSTAFARFCASLTAFVAENPGIRLGDAERELEHPYRTRSNFVRMLGSSLSATGPTRDRRLEGVRIEGRGVNAALWPMGDAF